MRSDFDHSSYVLSSSDKKKIEGSAYHPEAGMINASNVVNIISLVIAILGIVVGVLFFGGLAVLEGF